MAHFSKDALLINTLKAGGDLFIMIASQWLNKDPSQVTKQERTHVGTYTSHDALQSLTLLAGQGNVLRYSLRDGSSVSQ